MQRVGFFYDDVLLNHEPPPWHPERKERLLCILDRLRNSGLLDRLVLMKPRRATFDDAALVHTGAYIERIRTFQGNSLDPDTYTSPGTLEATLHAAGSLLEAVDRCRLGEIRRAFCAVRPPGHHAEADAAMGFCIFNNMAIGARYA